MATPSQILTTNNEGAADVITFPEGQFTTAEVQKGFATELRTLRAEAAAGIISDAGRSRLDELELILQERAAAESD